MAGEFYRNMLVLSGDAVQAAPSISIPRAVEAAIRDVEKAAKEQGREVDWKRVDITIGPDSSESEGGGWVIRHLIPLALTMKVPIR